MAIIKTIQIHGNVSNCEEYINDKEKNTVKRNPSFRDIRDNKNIESELDYDINPEKTSYKEVQLVTGILCEPEHAAEEFEWARRLYSRWHGEEKVAQGKEIRTATHLIMSFPAGSDPQLVHQIGIEFMDKLEERGIGRYQAVISTHVNTTHPHNHILINSYSVDGRRKFADNKTTLAVCRSINDELSIKYGLPVLQPGCDKDHNPSRGEKAAQEAGISWKDVMRQDMDSAASLAASYKEWRDAMTEMGYEIRELADGTPISISADGKHVRMSKLGNNYTFDAIVDKIARANGIDPASAAVKTPVIKIKDIYLEKVARYDENGRQRSDLEMLIREIIAFIKNLARAFDLVGDAIHVASLTRQADQLTKMVDTMSTYGIRTKQDLRDHMRDAGAHQKQLKAQVQLLQSTVATLQQAIADGKIPQRRSTEEIGERITHEMEADGKTQTHLNTDGLLPDDAKALQGEMKELIALYQQRAGSHQPGMDKVFADGIKDANIKLREHIEDAEARAKERGMSKTKDNPLSLAEIDPMTPTQKQELYIAVNNQTRYKLHAKFEQLSSTEASEAIDFLHGGGIGDTPAVFTAGYESPAVDQQVLQRALDHAQALLKSTLADIDTWSRVYKDLIYIKKGVTFSEDVKADQRDRKAKEQEKGKKQEKEQTHGDGRTVDSTGKSQDDDKQGKRDREHRAVTFEI